MRIYSMNYKGPEFSIESSGTKLRVRLNSDRYDWISNRGMSENGRMIALPAGEIATFPEAISGVLPPIMQLTSTVDLRVMFARGCPVTVTIESKVS